MDYSDVLRLECAKEFRLPKPVGEDNWKSRMDFCNKMTAAVDSYGTGDRLPKDFTSQIDPYFNNILECAVSERTQLSIAACKLLGALPKVLGRDMHPHVDRTLPMLIKLCANTKQVTVKMAAAAVASMVQNSTYSPRLLWHVCQAFEDKPAGPKQHGTVWLQTIMKEYHRSLNTHKETDMISRALLLALEDADASVRTSSRATYWTFNKINSDAAAEIMEKLNPHARTALQNDPHNPDKKAGSSKAPPPRPKSALADVRKEQVKKKRAEEDAQKQRKPLNTSTASHEGTAELHEPSKPKVKVTKDGFKPEGAPAAQPALDDRRRKDWQRVAADSKKAHKKALSQEEELISKPSVSSRLLSAPVRRPRINVTPLNPDLETVLPQAPRPASRTDHTAQGVQPKEAKKLDSRPTSSSSSKSASTGSSSAANTLRANIGASYLPDGKENAASYPTLPKKNRTINLPSSSPEKREDVFKTSGRGTAPPDKIHVGHQTLAAESAHEGQYEQRRVQGHRVLLPVDRPLPRYEQPLPRPDQPGYIDVKSARNYLQFGMKDLPAVLDDLIRCKKLKGAIEQHPDLITDRETWNELFEELCFSLVDKEELSTESLLKSERPQNARSNPYTRQLILQMTIPLIQNYPQWSIYRIKHWIWSLILYRCTLPNDPKDRRPELCMRNIDKIIRTNRMPLAFIVSALQAVESGEEVILDGFGTNQKIVERKRAERGMPLAIQPDPSEPLDEAGRRKRRPGQKWYEPTPYEDDLVGPDGPCDEGSRMPYMGDMDGAMHVPEEEDMNYQEKMAEAADRMKVYLRRAANVHAEADNQILPYPKTLPLLYDTALQVMELCLTEGYAKGHKLPDRRAEELCELARKCLESYDYMIKRSVIPFVKALYNMVEDKDHFFAHFKEEGTRNLLEYYLFESTR